MGCARCVPSSLDLAVGNLQNLLELALGLLGDGNPIQGQGILKTLSLSGFKCKYTVHIQGDTSGRLKPPVDLVPTVLAAGGPQL